MVNLDKLQAKNLAAARWPAKAERLSYECFPDIWPKAINLTVRVSGSKFSSTF
jgi:hypothetical protein